MIDVAEVLRAVPSFDKFCSVAELQACVQSCRESSQQWDIHIAGTSRNGAPIHHLPAAESPQAVLKRLDNWTDPRNVDRLTAERALDEIHALLPKLTTRSDSVEALYRAAEANVALNNTDAACETLTSLRMRAAGTTFSRAVTSLADSGLSCR